MATFVENQDVRLIPVFGVLDSDPGTPKSLRSAQPSPWTHRPLNHIRQNGTRPKKHRGKQGVEWMSRVEGFEGLASECGWFRVEAHGQLQVFHRKSPNSGREPRTIAGVQRSRSSEARFCPSLLAAQGCGAAYAWAARGWLELTCMGPWCKALCQESRHESSYLEAGGKMQRHSTTTRLSSDVRSQRSR